VHAELTLGQGPIVERGTVELLMCRAGIKGLLGSRWPKPKHQTPTTGDLVKRQFACLRPTSCGSPTSPSTPPSREKVYCAVVLEAWSRRVVGWYRQLADPQPWSPAPWTWPFAAATPTQGCLCIPNHGTQYTSWAFTDRASCASGLVASMGSIGDCYDNAMI
jgi:transposase InsO family protein